MGYTEYVKLCTALYGQFEYRPIIKVDPNIYHNIAWKLEMESITIQLPYPEYLLKPLELSMVHSYSCFLIREDGTITNQYKLAPGFRPTMVLLVVEVNKNPYPQCVILQMINNVYLKYINELF